MKIKNQFLLFFTLCLIVSLSYSQQTATLECDISALEDGSKAKDVCYFSEAPDIDPEQFTLEVEVNEEITWSGGESIIVKKIKHYRGTNIFSSDPEGDGRITARPNKPTDGKPYRYKILFNVDGITKTFRIDPIIKVKQ